MKNSFIFVVLTVLSFVNFSWAAATKQPYAVVVIKDEKPYYFIDQNKKPTGYAVELFENLAEDIGIEYNYIVVDSYAQAYRLFEQNKADIIPNIGIVKTKEHLFTFTQPTDSCDISIFQLRQSDIDSKEDLKKKTVGVVAKHHCEALLTQNSVKEKLVFDSFEKLLEALDTGAIDAIAYSNAMAKEKLKSLSNKQFYKSSYNPFQSQRGIGIAKKSFELLPLFDDAITKMQINGELEQLRQKWFEDTKFTFTYRQLVLLIALITILFLAMITLIVFFALKRKWVITKKNLQEEIEKKTQALQQSNETVQKYQRRLQSVMDNINDMIFYKDENLRYIGCNKMFERYMGKEMQNIIGKTDEELFGKESAKLIIQTDHEVLNSNRSQLRGDWIKFPMKGWVYSQTHLQPFEYKRGKTGLLGVSRDNTKLHLAQKKIKDQRYIDELTKINNRKSYNKRIKELLYNFERYGINFCIIMYDIDNFKNINDTYGHKTGDEVLIKMSKLVQKQLRTTDFLFRVGGEEFITLLTQTTLEDATKVAQKIRLAVYEKLAVIEGVNISISLGVTQVQKGDTIDSIFTRVDKLLYRSKREGKNRVSF